MAAGRPATLKIDILADATKANRELDKTQSKIGGFAKGLGVAAGAAAAAGAIAVGALAVASIKSASAVQQAFGATESIFGKHADRVKASARSAASDVGLAQSEYANLANVLGSQLKNMGTSADKLAPSTDKLIKQGADLAATFGGSTADAVSAVSSLLKGERDPIERYGVSIKQADINAVLAAKGLGKLTGAAKSQAEAQATLELLTKQTTAAQGSFARETGTLAGQQQRLGAMWENAKATLGSGLLPIITQLATYFTSTVAPAVQVLAARFRDEFGPALAQIGDFIVQKIIPGAQAFVKWYFQTILPAIKSAAIPILAGLRNAFESIREAVQRNEPQLRSLFNGIKTAVEYIIKYGAPVIGTVFKVAFTVLGGVIAGAIDFVSRMVDAVKGLVEWIQKLADKISNSGIVKTLGTIGGAVGNVGGKIGGLFSSGVSAAALASARGAGTGSLTAAGGGGGLAGSISNIVNVGSPTVVVKIGERELTEIVEIQVERHGRAVAHRLAVGVR